MPTAFHEAELQENKRRKRDCPVKNGTTSLFDNLRYQAYCACKWAVFGGHQPLGRITIRATSTLFICLSLLCASIAQAQASKGIHPPLPPIVENEQFIPYWTLEPGWHSEVELRNNRFKGDLVVRPILRTSFGREIPLDSVTVPPQEVSILDLYSAISKAAPELVGATGSFGSLSLKYSSSFVKNLYAGSMVHSEGKPFAFHFDGGEVDETFDQGSRESIWWLPNPTTTSHLIITNGSSKPATMKVVLYTQSGKRNEFPLGLRSRETKRLSLREIITSAGITETSGGLRVEVPKEAQSVFASQIVFDEVTGFSALMKFFERTETEEVHNVALRAPMLALANPDPALYLPAGTVLHPQILLRNSQGRSLEAHVSLRWRTTDKSGVTDLGAIQIPAAGLHNIDVYQLQQDGVIPKEASWASSTISYNGRYGDLVAIAASYEQEGHFGLQTPFTRVLASKWVGSKWFSDDFRNSIITVGNASDKPALANLTLHYDQGKKKYEVEQSLKPGEQIWLDVGKVIHEQLPDKNGDIIPADVQYGSYSIHDLTTPVGQTLFEGKLTIDKKFGHASYGCATCCLDTAVVTLDPNNNSVETGDSWQSYIHTWNPCDETYGADVTSDGNWWTLSPVASVTSTGYSTASTSAVGQGATKVNVSTYGYQFWCPIHTILSQGDTGVRPKITGPDTVWWFNGLNPDSTHYPTSITLTASGGSTASWTVTNGSSRVTLNPSGNQVTITSSSSHWSGATGDISITATVNGATSSAFTLTSKRPWKLVPKPGLPVTQCFFVPSNYGTTIKYDLHDNLRRSNVV